MNNIIPVDAPSLAHAIATSTTDEVLIGLNKQRFGFLIAAPDTGKGYLSLSLAYELATSIRLLGLSRCEAPLKTLLWPIEDGTGVMAKRLVKQIDNFSPDTKLAIGKNISIYDSDSPIMASDTFSLSPLGSEAALARDELIAAAKGFDLLIIDTLREAMGSADIIKDDLVVKTTLKKIAKEADIAILCVHHFTKETMKGNDKVTSISGTGLSSTQANSRYAITLESKKISGGMETQLRHIKGNDIPVEHKISTAAPLIWTDDSVLLRFPESFANLVQPTGATRKRKVPISSSAKEITIDESKLSEESKKLAQQNSESFSILDDDALVALRKHKAKTQ